MTGIKLHGGFMSTATWKVLACLYEKQVEFEFVPVNLRAGDQKKESFLSLNPFGQVPVLEHGDLKLFESRAITQFIAREYADKGTQLICAPDNKVMAILSVWMEVEAQKFDPVALKLVWELVFKPMFGMSADAAVIQENQEKLGKVLDVYESRLGQSKYLACDCFTLADLHHLPTITYLMETKVKQAFESRPRVAAWVADITARPAWFKVLDMRNKQ